MGHEEFCKWFLGKGGAIYAINKEGVATHQIKRWEGLQNFKLVSGAIQQQRIDLQDLRHFVGGGEIPADIQEGMLVWPRDVWNAMEQRLQKIDASRSIKYEYEVSNTDLQMTVKEVDDRSVTQEPFFVESFIRRRK